MTAARTPLGVDKHPPLYKVFEYENERMILYDN